MPIKRPNEENQGGGSRAAKKRAKKRQQQELKKKVVKNNAESPEDNILQEEIDETTAILKTKKMQLPMSDEEEELQPMQIIEKKVKKKKKKKKEKENKEISNCYWGRGNAENTTKAELERNEQDEVKDTDDQEDFIIDEILSQLNPYEILFPEKMLALDDETKSSEQGNEGSNPLELIQHISAKKRSRAVLNSVIAPSGISVNEFYKFYFEKKPLVISKSKNLAELTEGEEDDKGSGAKKSSEDELNLYRSRFNGFLTKERIKKIISNHSMMYGKDLNVTNFCKAEHGQKRRITLDQLPDMNDATAEEDIEYIQAESNDVWQNFDSGCTVRLLCPQQHNDEIHSLLSNFEHEFGCMVGSNAYLTPGGALNQGFAPHYDDIEAFILQLEGYKRWLVYPPMSKEQTLPRESSRDFTEDDMKDIDPVIDIVLGPGDVLYMPRGWVHQANTCRSDYHSLHLTISAWQHWSWADYLEIIMPEALEAATAKTTSLRSGLPRNFLSYMGTMHEQIDLKSKDAPEGLRQLAKNIDSDEDEGVETADRKAIVKLQEAFKADAKKKIMRVCKEALSMVTAGCDQIAKQYLSDRQPPAFTPRELELTSENRSENGGKIWPNTMVRLAKPGIAHLVIEDDKAVLYHSVDNSRVYREHPLSPLEFEIDDAPALESLLTTIEPHWICVQDLIHGDIEDKMEITQSLYDEGILAMFQNEKPDTTVQTG